MAGATQVRHVATTQALSGKNFLFAKKAEVCSNLFHMPPTQRWTTKSLTPERVAINREALGNNIMVVRKRKRWSLTFFAEQCECSVKTLNNIECGRQFPSFLLYVRICRTLGVAKPPFTESNTPFVVSVPGVAK